MKARFFLQALLFVFIISSCGKDEVVKPTKPEPTKPTTPTEPKDSTVTPPVISKKYQIDSIKLELKKNPLYKNIVRDSIWKDSAGVTLFYEYEAKYFRVDENNKEAIFSGAIFNNDDLKQQKFTVLPNVLNKKININYDPVVIDPVPSPFVPTKASIEAFRNRPEIVNNSTNLLDVSSSITSFKRYSEASVRTGRAALTSPDDYNALNTQFFLGSSLIPALNNAIDTINKKTGVFFNLIVDYYHIGVFLGDTALLTPEVAAETKYKSIINDVTYGHEVYIFLESDASEEELKQAIRRFSIIEGGNTATNIDKKILKEASARVHYKHANANIVSTSNLNGLERLEEMKKIIGRADLPNISGKGVPLIFRISTLDYPNSPSDYTQKIENRYDVSLK